MNDRPGLLERLRRLLRDERNGESPSPPLPPHADDLPPGCEDVEEIPCREAARRVYEYLDGELDEAESEKVRCHVQQCERCYPMFNWERTFLDIVHERGARAEANEQLRRRVRKLLDSEGG